MVGCQGCLGIGDFSRGWLLLYGSELVFDKLYVYDQILKHVWPKNSFYLSDIGEAWLNLLMKCSMHVG